MKKIVVSYIDGDEERLKKLLFNAQFDKTETIEEVMSQEKEKSKKKLRTFMVFSFFFLMIASSLYLYSLNELSLKEEEVDVLLRDSDIQKQYMNQIRDSLVHYKRVLEELPKDSLR